MRAKRKGAVSIERIKGKATERLRLRWRYGGQRVTLAVGEAGDPIAELKAEQLALVVAIDLASAIPEAYDESLAKYREILDPRGLGCGSMGVLDLYKEFFNHRSKTLEKNSLSKWNAVEGKLQIFGDKKAAQVTEKLAQLIFDALPPSPETRRSYLSILRACWDYGQLKHGLKLNPWALIPPPPIPSPDPDPFTAEEVLAILGAFEGLYYYRFVCGLLGLGCRIGEAAALTWADVDFERGAVRISKAWDGSQVKQTKNKKTRWAPYSATLGQIFRDMKAELDPEPDALVFPSRQGKPIDHRNFLRRHWMPVLERAGVRYRPTYKCRHSVWSHAVLTMPIAEAARNAGNLPATLLRNYVGVVSASPMPDLLVPQSPRPSSDS